jgi:hypothetical protein
LRKQDVEAEGHKIMPKRKPPKQETRKAGRPLTGAKPFRLSTARIFKVGILNQI